MMHQNISNDLITETAGEILRNIFGGEASGIILGHFKENNSENLRDKTKFLSDLLASVFGEGATIIEDLILETLYSKCGVALEHKNGYEFPNYVEDLMERAGKRET